MKKRKLLFKCQVSCPSAGMVRLEESWVSEQVDALDPLVGNVVFWKVRKRISWFLFAVQRKNISSLVPE